MIFLPRSRAVGMSAGMGGRASRAASYDLGL